MKPIKRSIHTIVAGAILLLNFSCAKDFLEQPASSITNIDSVFANPDRAMQALFQVYKNANVSTTGGLCTQFYEAGDYYGWANGGMMWSYSDEGNQSVAGAMARGMQDGTWGPNKAPIEYKYDWAAAAMRSAWIFINNADKVPYQQTPSWNWNEAYKNRTVSEAKFWLALMHFEYARRFGGIPIMDRLPTYTNTGSGLTIIPSGERSSLRRSYDFILKLCDEMIPYLEDNLPAEQYGRVTKSAAMALKAKVLLYAASPLYNEPAILSFDNPAMDTLITFHPNVDANRWVKARDAAKAAIDFAEGAGYEILDDPGYSKSANYLYATTVPSISSPMNKEVFLERRDRNGTPDNAWYTGNSPTRGQWQGRSASVGVNFVKNNFRKLDGTDITLPDQGTFAELKSILRNMEPRFHAICWMPGYPYSEITNAAAVARGERDTALFNYYDVSGNLKYSKTSAITQFFGPEQGIGWPRKWFQFGNDEDIGWPLFRLPELYLNYAEAANEVNPNDPLIITYLNKIRTRGGLPNFEAVPETAAKIGDKDLMREEIRKERAVELWGEEHRYFDVKRWKMGEINGGRWDVLEIYENGTGSYVNPVASWTLAQWEANIAKLSYRIVESSKGGDKFSPRVWSDKMYFYPWPQGEINKGIITQNPGW
jgi:hypothetical protein